MLDISKDIQSLTDFKKNTPAFLNELKESERALVLTINGRSELTVMSAETFQGMLSHIEELETLAGIRRGLEDVKAGRVRPASEAFAEMRQTLDVSTPEDSE